MTTPPISRRDALRSLAATTTLATVPGWLSAWPALGRQDRALIVVWMDGGMSHLDTFDVKPEASAEIRGALGWRETRREGVFFSEHLPQLAERMDRLTLVRSLTSGEGNHDRGSCYVLTGRRPSPLLTHPSIGATLSWLQRTGSTEEELAALEGLPAYVAVPRAPAFGGPGFLPLTCGPFEVEGDPSRPDFAVRNLTARPRLDRVLELIDRVDGIDGDARSPSERARDETLGSARSLSLDADTRAAFDLRAEDAATRQTYGHHRLGQSCLLARRLVERGVRSVIVRYEGWDDHRDIRNGMTYGFPPKLVATDQALAALVDDLARRGLEDRVAVVVASEFGRTPRLNPAGGRDHWPRAFSALLFGAGLRRGAVVGSTDERGAEPRESAVSPSDLQATLLATLGVGLDATLHTSDGRPVRLVPEDARPIRAALAEPTEKRDREAVDQDEEES